MSSVHCPQCSTSYPLKANLPATAPFRCPCGFTTTLQELLFLQPLPAQPVPAQRAPAQPVPAQRALVQPACALQPSAGLLLEPPPAPPQRKLRRQQPALELMPVEEVAEELHESEQLQEEEPHRRPQRRRRRSSHSPFSALKRLTAPQRKMAAGGAAILAMLSLSGITLAAGWNPLAQDPLAHVPGNMDVVMRVNLEDFRQEFELDQAFDKMPQEVLDVLDPNDIKNVYAAVDTTQVVNGKGLLCLVEVRLSPKLLTQALRGEKQEVREKSYQGHTYYMEKGNIGGFMWLGGGLFAIGDEATLKRVIDLEEGKGSSIRENERFMEVLDGAEEAMFWIAADLGGKTKAGPGAARGLDSILILADREGDVATLAATVQFTSTDHAKEAQTALDELARPSAPTASAPAGTVQPRSSMAQIQETIEGLIVGKSVIRINDRVEVEVQLDLETIRALAAK